ncbi:hypothetical protein GCM10009827_101110 [Dactylosporangium maewongense]|uniref:Type I-U CRISPR-associated protein Cas7 n=1 Tax=Dactylosporangium maewongense TaxID=634393 RepID=A0ABP4NNF3_9ACTN
MSATRHVYDVPLRPVLGSTFQPTGFPDLGPATFDRLDADGGVTPSLLVESVQSMANRLEATLWDRGAQQPVEVTDGLPYVRVVRAGTDEFLTSSRLEAHRLASPFVREAACDGENMEAVIGQRLGLARDTPLNLPAMARALLQLDPLCLLHGVFFAQKAWIGQPRFPRAVSAVIEAHDVRRAVSGGRKSDSVRHQLNRDTANGEDSSGDTGVETTGGGTAEGYGSVPFHRVEWTARTILATFVVDRELLHSYGLPQPASDLLETLALWEIRALLSGGLRLRTACDLELADDISTRRGEPLPETSDLTGRLRDLIGQCADLLGDGKAITVQWGGHKTNAKAASGKAKS